MSDGHGRRLAGRGTKRMVPAWLEVLEYSQANVVEYQLDFIILYQTKLLSTIVNRCEPMRGVAINSLGNALEKQHFLLQ